MKPGDFMNLTTAQVGKEYIIRDINTDDEELNSFLFSLGCYSGETITVVTRRKHGCVVSIKDGRYNIDNNAIENVIRPIAVGRKNYLFCGNHDAAVRAAIVYSLFSSCKAHDVDVRTWLEDILKRIPEEKIIQLYEDGAKAKLQEIYPFEDDNFLFTTYKYGTEFENKLIQYYVAGEKDGFYGGFDILKRLMK